ncbi:SDR family NAD(P)-dependent oxidoreductase [uncultured Umboniibacter sp.]|uniref:SDR family NAD(P)-dependent oxidoreductase n=1 Tax=uncultured Umboniibacter sp. TaxID=1798917 RepID=UPI00262D31BB|nr:SDR family NAD(P)-dependent oxidoreductase [uncultured Umboniibacter sp.]
MRAKRNLIAVISGTTSGIGVAVASALHREGWQVIGVNRNPSLLKQELGEGYAELIVGDSLEDYESIGKQLATITSHINFVFCNAGYGLQVAMEDAQLDALERMMRVNVTLAVALANGALPLMFAAPTPSRRPWLLFNSSVLGIESLAFRGPYAASKHALEAMATSYGIELSGKVDVSTLQLGPVGTGFRQRALLEIKQSKLTGARLDYRRHIQRLANKNGASDTPTHRVADRVLSCLAGRRPARLRVGAKVFVVVVLKRLLSTNWMRAFLGSVEPAEEVRRIPPRLLDE